MALTRRLDPSLIGVCLLAGVLSCWSLTRNGYANSYYAEAALAASHSWTALLTNAADLSGAVSLDKGPLSDWMMGLSGRVFGFSSLSMLLPSAACGVGAVGLLHDLVRRTLGRRTALLAGLMLAVSPVSLAMARYNNPDALLALLLVGAAWALVRGLESGRLRHFGLCGAVVGLAFDTKMLEAFIVLPAFTVVLLGAVSGKVGHRVRGLAAGAAGLAVVGGAWYGTMMALPAADRPYVGDSTGNSWLELIFGANGLSRVSGGGTGPGPGRGGSFGGATGPLRLFGDAIGGQIAWLLPLALVGLVVGLWSRRRAARTDPARAVVVLLGLWALTGYVVFSFSEGIFHPYYTSAIAPAVAGLAAAGLVGLADAARTRPAAAVALALAVGATAVLAERILGRTPDFVPWLRPAVLVAGGAAAALILVARRRRALVVAAVGAGLVAVLAGPTAYSLATLGYGQTGTMPSGGPQGTDGFGGFGGFAGVRRAPDASGADPALVAYLERNRGGAKFVVAAEGSTAAAPIGLATGDPVVTMGGFMGADPAPSVADLAGLVRSGQLRYVLLGGGPGRRGFGFGFAAAPPQPLFGPGAELFGGGPPGGDVDSDRAAWVRTNCTAVTVPGGLGVGANLYRCT